MVSTYLLYHLIHIALDRHTNGDHHTIIRAAFVCVFVCFLSPRWSFGRSSPNLLGVCRLTSHLPLRGSFRKGQRLDGSTGHFRFPLYYICASLTPHAATAPFACQAAESNSAPFAVLHVNDVCWWTWQLLLRGSFSKRSMGRRVKRVNGSTGHFHFHYIIYDSRRRQAHATPLQKAHSV